MYADYSPSGDDSAGESAGQSSSHSASQSADQSAGESAGQSSSRSAGVWNIGANLLRRFPGYGDQLFEGEVVEAIDETYTK